MNEDLRNGTKRTGKTSRPFCFEEKKMEQFFTFKKNPYFIAGILVFLGLYLASLYSYLLFHSLAEIFSIVVACGIFMVAWNSRRFLDNHYFLFIGIAYLFVGGLDLLHTLAYKGMGVFQGYETNLPTQLWIAARYMGSLSLFLAPFFLGRKLKVNSLFLGYALATFLLLMSMFYWNIFPVCFIEGVGLTPFKKISEYIISLILLASIALLLMNRKEFDREVLQWVVWSIIVSIASELAFTFYIDPYGFSNLIGHFLKILSFYLIYKAIIVTGLTKPYDLLFRNLKQSEMTAREEKNKIQNYLDIAGVTLVVIDADQTVGLVNKKGCEILGYDEGEILGKKWFDTFIPEKNRDGVRLSFEKLMKGEIETVEYFENPILTRSGEERIVGWNHTVLRDEKGNITSTLSSGEDITERKQAEEAIRAGEERTRDQAARLQTVLDTAPAIIWIAHDRECREIIGNRAAYVFLQVPEGTDVSKSGSAPERLAHFHVFKDGLELKPQEMPIQKVAASGQGLSDYTMELVFNDGTMRSVLGNISPVLDSEGQPNGAIAAFIDITERKRMAEELRKSRDELELRVQERTAELTKANEKLEEQSRILEAFFTSTITPLVFLDRNFNFIRVNEAYAKACQREVSEFPGHNHFEFYPSDARQIFEQVVMTKEPYHAIARSFTFPDHPEWGTSYWDWTLTPLLDDRGEVEFLVFSLEDVTERVRAEKSRGRLAHIVEATSDLIGMANLDGQLFYLNKAGRKMLGFSEEEDISGVRIADAHPDWASVMVLTEGIPSALQTGLWNAETAFLSRDGTEIPISQVILAHKGPNGEVEFLSTIARDITERKRAEEALKAERQRFNDVLEMLPAYLVLLTPDYHVPFANRFFRERFGESHGRRCFEYLFGRSEPCEICETYTVLKTMAPHEWEWTGPDGRIYDVFDFPFTDTDGSPLILEMGIDITERKRAEEALRESENRLRHLSSQLLTVQENERKSIARELHDGIGQILTAIKFKVENILQEKGKGKARAKEKSLKAIVPMVRESVEEVRRIQMDLRPSTLDDLGILATLGWFCREYQNIYSHIRIEKEIGLQESEVSTPLKTVIYRLTQEALNNIAKHSKADLIHLSLRKREDRVEWVVKDNGIGFDLEEILSSERSKRGLGLNSMRERTELSGGIF